jgi:hypothetical protein
MATYDEILQGLTDAQKQIITMEISKREETKEKEARKEKEKALQEAKAAFKSEIQSVRKPETYTASKNISLYFDTWESYATSLSLKGDKKTSSFLTYLDAESFQKLKVQEIHKISNWDNFKEAAIGALQPAISKMTIKQKLRNMKQLHNETVSEFYDRILALSSRYFDLESSEEERSTLLKETLATGLKNDDIAVKIIENDIWKFRESYDYAVRREQSRLARKEISGDGAERRAVLEGTGSSTNGI